MRMESRRCLGHGMSASKTHAWAPRHACCLLSKAQGRCLTPMHVGSDVGLIERNKGLRHYEQCTLQRLDASTGHSMLVHIGSRPWV